VNIFCEYVTTLVSNKCLNYHFKTYTQYAETVNYVVSLFIHIL